MNAGMIITAVVVFVLWVGSLYVAPFGRCPRCHGKGNIRRRNRRPVCPRCKGRKRVQRRGSRAVHQIARAVREGREAAARHQEDRS